MTGIEGFTQTFVSPLLRRWWIVVGLGVAVIIVGSLLLADLATAADVLAIIVAIGLLLTGVDEIAQAERHRERWPSYVLCAIWVVTALIALVWPDVTLWALAITVGLGLLVGGVAEVGFAMRYRRELPMWGVWLLDGGASVLVGILALAWPEATILILAILLGVRVLLRGVATVTFGLALRQIHLTTTRAHM